MKIFHVEYSHASLRMSFIFFVKPWERAGHLDPKCPPCNLEHCSIYFNLLCPKSDTHSKLADVVICYPFIFVHNLNSEISHTGDILNMPYLIQRELVFPCKSFIMKTPWVSLSIKFYFNSFLSINNCGVNQVSMHIDFKPVSDELQILRTLSNRESFIRSIHQYLLAFLLKILSFSSGKTGNGNCR